jgi:hypothetical protein
VLVTERIRPLEVQGRTLHQVGLPWHWGPNGYTTGDAANELAHLALDPNVHIPEVKAMACDIRPGRPATRASPMRPGTAVSATRRDNGRDGDGDVRWAPERLRG